MKKRKIGIDALLVILGIAIGVLIGVVISKRGINLASVREGQVVAHQPRVEVVYSARLSNHVNPFDRSKQFDQATVLHAARQLNHEKLLNRSSHFDHTQVPDAGAAAQSGKTPEFHNAGHNAG